MGGRQGTAKRWGRFHPLRSAFVGGKTQFLLSCDSSLGEPASSGVQDTNPARSTGSSTTRRFFAAAMSPAVPPKLCPGASLSPITSRSRRLTFGASPQSLPSHNLRVREIPPEPGSRLGSLSTTDVRSPNAPASARRPIHLPSSLCNCFFLRKAAAVVELEQASLVPHPQGGINSARTPSPRSVSLVNGVTMLFLGNMRSEYVDQGERLQVDGQGR